MLHRLVKTLARLSITALLSLAAPAFAQQTNSDPLPSWNEGATWFVISKTTDWKRVFSFEN
jgi:hypothetical protein